jgi:hypothetical protein
MRIATQYAKSTVNPTGQLSIMSERAGWVQSARPGTLRNVMDVVVALCKSKEFFCCRVPERIPA